MIPITLVISGFILIFLEFFLPGAILGVSGGLLIFFGILLFAQSGYSGWLVLAFILLAVLGVFLTIKFALWKIPRSKSRNIYSDDAQEGYQASEFDKDLIGKIGVVRTDLKPGGYIFVEGKQVQAISQSGYLAKGTKVLIIGGQEESLIVKQLKQDDKQ
ncbi:MAG: hypothetical protein BGO10_10820 [Chlamydia sp. 32-24]|nr:MAG: hypothetical protein BGO10_10820 [Chlamydia sp. 32-24]